METFLRHRRGTPPLAASNPAAGAPRRSGARAARDSVVGTPQQFTRDRRVRQRGEFQAVFERGTRLHSRFFTLLLLPNGRPSSRLGIVASRKFGGSVRRNRAKRLIREVFRQNVATDREPPVDIVVIPKREMLAAPFPDLANDFLSGLRRGADRLEKHGRR